MDSNQVQASKILFDLVAGLEPRLQPIAGWYSETVRTIDKWFTSEGNQGLKRAKDILSQAWLIILGEDPPELSFVSQTEGVPTLVAPLIKRVQSLSKDARLLSAVLSLVRVTDLWLGQPQDSDILKSLSVIADTKLPSTAEPIIKEFKDFLNLFIRTCPNHPVMRALSKAITLSDRSRYLYRESRGPNGPLTRNAHKDVKSLCEAVCADGKTLFQHIDELQEGIASYARFSFRSSMQDFPTRIQNWDGFKDMNSSPTPGKLSIIPEKSGKLRLVAQPDYYTQLTMHPLHDWLMDVLTSFTTDCTMDQRSAIPKIATWQAEGREIYSFDQSSCTDLFPFELQLVILESRFDAKLTEGVKTVMSDREWEVKLPSGLTKRVRWSVGQPMGILGSWPLMAVAHHFIVQYAYWRSSGKFLNKEFKPYNRYVICGDDIVIADKSVAESYLRVVKNLGMKVNLSKSHITGGSTGIDPTSEFAKITVWKGQPLFPIRPNMVLSSVKDWRYAVPLFIDLASVEGFAARLKFFVRTIKKHYAKRYKFLIPLLTVPRELGGVGYRDSVSLKEKFSKIKTGAMHPWLYFIAQKIRSGLILEDKLVDVEGLDCLPSGLRRGHPLWTYLSEQANQMAFYHATSMGEIPSVCQIAEVLVTEGVGNYSRFLINKDTKAPPTWREQNESLNEMRTMWERSYAKDHYFLSSDVRRLMKRSLYDASLSELPYFQRFGPESQRNLLESTLMAMRLNTD